MKIRKMKVLNWIITSFILFSLYNFSSSLRKQKEKLQSSSILLDIQKRNRTIVFKNDKQYGRGDCSVRNNCYLPYGICLNATTCMCMPDFANHPSDGNSTGSFCTYQKKSIVVAGLLELFLPFGLGHFYAGHTLLGSIKLAYNCFIYLFGCILHLKDSSKNEDTHFDMVVICILLSLLIPVWNILDLFLFFTGGYKDGYGIELA